MPLSLEDQYNLATTAWYSGDFDLMERLLTAPDSVLPNEQRSVAQMLGLHGGFLSAAVNLSADPTVWLAMFLSRKFPTSQYLRGVVPHRFIGTSNEFSGLSTVARTVEGFFRGTPVSKLISLKMRREAEVVKLGGKIFDVIESRPAWAEEMPIVSLLLEGQHPSGATPELREVASRIRGHMDELWQFLKKTHRTGGGFDNEQFITRGWSRPFTLSESPRYLRDYLPHIPLLGNESVLETSGKEALAKFGKSRMAQAMQMAGQNPAEVWRLEAGDRLASNWHKYQNFMARVGTQVFNPRLFRRTRMSQVLESPEGRENFVTDLNLVLNRYIHSVARSYALNAPLSPRERMLASVVAEQADGTVRRIVPTDQPVITQIVNYGLDASSSGRYLQQTVPGTNRTVERLDLSGVNHPSLGALKSLVRNVMGYHDESEILFGNLYSKIRSRASNLAGVLGKRKSLQLEDAMATMSNRHQDREAINRITSYFYASTLGLNPLSTIRNLFQPMLTTVPTIGIGPTLEGYRVLRQRIPRYIAEFTQARRRLAGRNVAEVERINVAQEQAFNRIFPELAQYGIRADPRAFELDERALITDPVSGKSRFRNFDSYMKFLLQPFTQAELSNQVVSFYGGKEALRRAIKRGEMDIPELVPGVEPHRIMEDLLNEEAAGLVNATQFRPGPGSRTVLQSHLPPPLRMFTSFFTRLGNHFAESTVRGALLDSQLQQANVFHRMVGGRNLGTLARTYLVGKVVTDGLRSGLGINMEDSLGITGPFTNIAPSGQLFYPLPVPPLPGMLFSLASFTVQRDPKVLNPMTLPFGLETKVPIPKSLVPGGIAISRVFRAFRQYRPDVGGFVDDNERLMYMGDTSDFILSMLGIPLDKERRLREGLEQLSDVRSRVSRYRRQYAVASRAFDTNEMAKLEAAFAEDFPDLGKLSISRQDKRRYDEQARITATQRMVRSLGTKFGFLEGDIYQTDPDLIAGGGF